MKGTYLGPEYSNKEITLMNRKEKAVSNYYKNFDDLIEEITTKISSGNVIGWFQGRMEFGPRALGNRSIIADARNPEMQKKINLNIKNREGFRPFAPSVLLEEASKYFDIKKDSPYMLFVAPLLKTFRKNNLNEDKNLSFWNKLYQTRSDFQAITHLDFTSRLHTVTKSTNEKYWKLLKTIKQKTGFGMLINTSFNVRGEPMVCNPYDAYRCFMNSDMDYLVINNFVYFKKDQLGWQNKEKWKIDFNKD
jgi:carbamoyltransferase